ncbi:D-alanyl-D-alanine carboxypeptidase, partial [Streptomyces sp. SID5785]|uniref:D-alanyl-D-alanine carboxypeptidase family protein n=1 Tax=Streptomyces sp. SID5785 TaxID=2690309 RepID=UPI001361811F
MPGTTASQQFSRRAALGIGLGATTALALPAPRATAASGTPRLPRLNARAWLVADHGSRAVLAASGAHRALPPASTLKMLFADTVLPRFGTDEKHKVTAADLAGIPAGSSLVGIQAGTTYTVRQLWQGVFLRSGNDAVHVLAAMNGGVAKTVEEMQARAEELGADSTRVVSPDGFDHPGQVSSAYDLTLFAHAGLKNDAFRAYCATRTADFPAGGGKTFQLQNTDRLLTGQGVPPYEGLIGVKNGYTTNAGNTFTGAATRGDRTLIVTVMHPESGYEAVYEETAALLDWGFAAADRAKPVGTLAVPVSERAPKNSSPGQDAARGDLAAGAPGPSRAGDGS